MRNKISLAILMASLTAGASAAESSFDYNYFGFSYGMQRIGFDGFSDEVAGHVFAADYAEEISDRLVYTFHIDKTFSEDSIYSGDDQLRVDINEYNLNLGFGHTIRLAVRQIWLQTQRSRTTTKTTSFICELRMRELPTHIKKAQKALCV